ncbi:vesicle-associated protein 1-2-like [Silene latifolia]|uniref:vesicle-associated protein 1-2-like n=1 Tax=Silene latifolia TaxID=37657 RepID=UPI003D775A7B
MHVTNSTDNYVFLKVKTTNCSKYWVQPHIAIVSPHSTFVILVNMQAQKEAPVDNQCKDKFLLQSVIINPESTFKDITNDMFEKESGNIVDEYFFKVAYVSSPQPLHAIEQEVSDGRSLPKPSAADNGILNATAGLNRNSVMHFQTSSTPDETQYLLTQAKALIYRLIDERDFTNYVNNKLRRETDSLRREMSIIGDGVLRVANHPFIPRNKQKID